jgi:hypothetical protein
MRRKIDWQHIRLVIAVVLGTLTLLVGIHRNNPAMMTIGAGLIGFSPAANGPRRNGNGQPPETSKLVVP